MNESADQSSPGGIPADGGAEVEIKVPATGAFVSTLRTTTAALASRLDFTIDDVEDLRIAVGEAAAMALGHATAGSSMVARFVLEPRRVRLAVSVPARDDEFPAYDSFTWTVLAALATDAQVSNDDGAFTVSLTLDSSLAGTDA